MRLLVTIPLMAIAFTAQASAASDSEVKQQLERHSQAYHDTYMKKDAKALTEEFYAPNAVLVDARGNKHTGPQQIEQAFSGLFQQIGTLKSFDDKIDEAHALGDNYAWAIGRGTIVTDKFPEGRTIHYTGIYQGKDMKIILLSFGAMPPSQPQTAQTPSSRQSGSSTK